VEALYRVATRIQADPEAHPTNADFWRQAKVVMPRAKQTVTIRLDADRLTGCGATKIIRRGSMLYCGLIGNHRNPDESAASV
jgi:hypothetical protein